MDLEMRVGLGMARFGEAVAPREPAPVRNTEPSAIPLHNTSYVSN
jgi:hypothetical protein